RRRESHEGTEERADDLPFLREATRSLERRSALGTESGSFRSLTAAVGADHGSTLGGAYAVRNSGDRELLGIATSRLDGRTAPGLRRPSTRRSKASPAALRFHRRRNPLFFERSGPRAPP